MRATHWVRVGRLGQLGRFESPTGACFPRGTRVVCRTQRGQEIGEVLNSPTPDEVTHAAGHHVNAFAGQVLRRVSVEDELLLARLDRYRLRAFRACRRLLRQRKIAGTLIDVEHLLDGQGLYFYFLGAVPPEVDALTQELAELYAAKIEFHRFADTLQHGCGPDCGTEAGSGCGTSCQSCTLLGACSSKPREGQTPST